MNRYMLLAGTLLLAGCSARDPVTQTPVYHVGTPTNRSSVNSWELDQAPTYTQPGVYRGRPVHLRPIPSQRGWEPDDPLAVAVMAALGRDGAVPTVYLSASGRAGVVILVGGVTTPAQKARAERVARAVPGVRALRSRLVILVPR